MKTKPKKKVSGAKMCVYVVCEQYKNKKNVERNREQKEIKEEREK